MTKADARENGEAMRWFGVPGGTFRYNTGGSTGQPLIFQFGRWRQASGRGGPNPRPALVGRHDVGTTARSICGARRSELAKTDLIKTIRDRMLNQLFAERVRDVAAKHG